VARESLEIGLVTPPPVRDTFPTASSAHEGAVHQGSGARQGCNKVEYPERQAKRGPNRNTETKCPALDNSGANGKRTSGATQSAQEGSEAVRLGSRHVLVTEWMAAATASRRGPV